MGYVRRLLPAIAAVLLALGVASCGDDDSGSATKASTQSQSEGSSSNGTAPGEEARKDDSPSGADTRAGARSGDGEAGGSGSAGFVPKEHEDSGGGSAQFRIKGGDNSVQEFGQEADDVERNEAATALHNFLDARVAEEWRSACSFLAEDIRESLEELAPQGEDTSCAGILAKSTNRAALPALRSEAAKADVGSLRIEGDRAFVLYRGIGETIIAFPMTNEGGSWKVAALAGVPLN